MPTIRNGKVVVVNKTGVYEYPYTKIRGKKIYYNTRLYSTNGNNERARRIKQMLKRKK